jgi:rod shape determining protein RodA
VLGVPLPLFSKGGSSMVAVLMALGIVLAIERDQAKVTRRAQKK